VRRIKQVEQALRKLPKGKKISARELAEELGLSRSNVSGDLNRLCKEGIAVKSGTKPVYYAPADPSNVPINAFDLFLQENTSLFHCGELAKAAVLYPPHGMHIMLFGETGVGKSMFASLIFEYARSQLRIEEEGSFVSFNCADYANNPQLLISQLFGVSKGAYTGADVDRSGLLEQADKGVLFLDEVHRLPPEGQEMLFTYIDHGHYRRLGETNSVRTAEVLLICATTEDPGSVLLKTFTRRIPMHIKIPSLDERSIEERLNLISRFFTAESDKLKQPILVSVNSVRALLGYTCANNVGQLQSDIQLLCARAYADFVSRKKGSINISSYSLPPFIRNGIFTERNRQRIWNMLAGINTRFVSFDAATPLPLDKRGSADIYDIIERRTEELRRVGASEMEIDELINGILTDYYHRYDEKNGPGTGMKSLVGTEITATVNKMLSLASRELGRSFSPNLAYSLSLHLSSAIQRFQQGLPIKNPRLEAIQRETPELYRAAQKALDAVEEDFNIRLPPDEAGFIALFFAPAGAVKPPVQIIVAAHGSGMASSLVETANQFLNCSIIKGFDVPFDKSQFAVYEEIKAFLKENPARDVLLLVDMGSLINYAQDLEKDLCLSIRCIPLVSTLHVLEAGRKAQLGYSLENVYRAVQQITSRISVPQQYFPHQKLYILTVCTTGEGSARILENHLNEKLDLKNGLCEIIPLQIADTKEFNEQTEKLCSPGRIIMVVSAFSTNLAVPHFKPSSGMDAASIEAMQRLIDIEEIFLQVCDNMEEALPKIGEKISYWSIREMIERICRALAVEPDADMLIGVFCHICCMLDRVQLGEWTGNYPGKEQCIAKHSRELNLIRREYKDLEAACGVKIPEDENYYLYRLIKREIVPI
jgi:transcriptional regulator with AAA-type ATPase domain/transcriptional regulatory protein LevR